MILLLSFFGFAASGILGYTLGETRGWHRRGSYEPEKSIDLMEQENRLVRNQSQQFIDHVTLLMRQFSDTCERNDSMTHRNLAERRALHDHVMRKFMSTCDRIVRSHMHELRTGPWTEHTAREFIGSVLDSVYDRRATIAAGVEQLLEHLYFDPQPRKAPAVKVPVSEA